MKKQTTKDFSPLIDYIKKTPLEIKILFLILFSLTTGFGSYVIYSLNSETQALQKQYKLRSNLFAETLTSGIRNIMLSGRSPYVGAFISDARDEFNEVGQFSLFNNNAEEIYPDINPHISIILDDLDVKKALDSKIYTDDIYPLVNENSCQVCHNDNADIRGSIKVNFESASNWSQSLLEVVNSAFQAIMLSGKGEYADTLLFEINNLLGVDLIQVYNEDASYVSFGDDVNEIDETILENMLENIYDNNDFESSHIIDKHHFSPLPNLAACQVCHGTDSQLNGILAIDIKTSIINKDDVKNAIIIGFNNLMRLQKASYAGAYIEEIRKLSFVSNFQIFDNGQLSNLGYQELWVPNPQYNKTILDTTIANLIQKYNKDLYLDSVRSHHVDNINSINHLTQMMPIVNDEKCQVCHEPPSKDSPLYPDQKNKWKVRSIIKISTSMEEIEHEINKNKKASIIMGIITLLFVSLLMRIFMKITVLKPLDIIGTVADRIREGDLSVNAHVKSKDEIGQLAERINSMIKGLQERLNLSKFVSKDAMMAVKGVGLEGLSLGGTRIELTLIETDIRGFTAMSEKMEPEEVVEIINTYLNKQAEIIQEYGGDIDKYIGDAILAVFRGEDMILNSIECTIKIQSEIKKLNIKMNSDIGIGIGINTGTVVMGPMGNKDRMDFTVIGDNVNLTARLCDNAEGGEIITTKSVINHLPEGKFEVVKLKDIKVKGKEKPITIYKVS